MVQDYKGLFTDLIHLTNYKIVYCFLDMYSNC
jgi:hypothetical protein